MKKSVFYYFLPVMLLCGCTVVEPEVTILESKHFEAITECYDPGTKTSLDQNGNILWKKGDQISVFAGSTINEQYQVSDASDGQTSAKVDPVSPSGFSAGGTIDNNVAFYPYSSTATIEKSGSNYILGSLALPSTQSYTADSFGNGAFPMAAVTNSTADMNLKFKNILGGLKLQLTGTATISSISISGNNSEILCGAANVTVSTTDLPAISLTDATATTVTLNCGDGVQLNSTTPTSFVIALPAMTMSGGFTVTVIDTNGKQMEIKTTKSQTIKRSSLLKMPEVNYAGEPVVDYSSEPFTITSIGSTSISFKRYGSRNQDVELLYRIGAGNWSEYSIGTVINLHDGETLQFRAGSNSNGQFSLGYYGFSSYTSNDSYYYLKVTGTGNIIASGNIMSLLDKDLSTEYVPDFCFCSLFSYCSSLIDASHLILPSTSLSTACYLYLFDNCTNLTAAPELPATSLAAYCYHGMFADCSSLITVPELPATTLADYCYQSMFYGCTSLSTAPALQATTLAQSCYAQMFSDCTSLITAPALPATTLAKDCYRQMFLGCTSLSTAPALSATTLEYGCYCRMFQGCTSLSTAPTLSATTLAEYCYQEMFNGCTRLITAPALPATSLSSGCYSAMFQGCTSLSTAPTLLATKLAESCYRDMFSGCASLNYVKALFETTPGYSYTFCWLEGVSSTGTFVKSKNATWDVFGSSGIPTGWTVLTE